MCVCRYIYIYIYTHTLVTCDKSWAQTPYNCIQISICNRQTAALHLVKWRVYLFRYGSKLLRIVDPPILPSCMDQADLQKRPAIWVCLKKGCPQIFTIQHIQLVIVSLSDYRHLWQLPFARCILHTQYSYWGGYPKDRPQRIPWDLHSAGAIGGADNLTQASLVRETPWCPALPIQHLQLPFPLPFRRSGAWSKNVEMWWTLDGKSTKFINFCHVQWQIWMMEPHVQTYPNSPKLIMINSVLTWPFFQVSFVS